MKPPVSHGFPMLLPAIPRQALRHYEKLVTSAAKLVAPNGMLFVASCTYAIGATDEFGRTDR